MSDSQHPASEHEKQSDVSKSINTYVSHRSIIYATVVAFLAMTFSIYDYALFGVLLPVMSDDLGWSTATSTAIATWVSVGVFVFALTVGPMLDYLGRKSSLILVTVGTAVSSGLSALTPNALYLVIVRAVSGLGFSEQIVNATYLSELYGTSSRQSFFYRHRGFLYSLVQGGFVVGTLVASAMTALLLPVVGWRGSFLVAFAPAIIIVLLGVKLKESPKFEAMKHLKQLQREGSHEEATKFGYEHNLNIQHSEGSRNTYRQLLEPGVRRQTFFLGSAFMVQWFAIQVLAILGTTVLTEAKGITFGSALTVLIVGNATAYVGYIAHGILGDIIGRRKTISIGWITAGVIFALMLLGPSTDWVVLTLYAIGLFFLQGANAALFFFFGEAFPTRMRGTGAAFVNALGPIGAIIGSALLTLFLNADLGMITAAFITGPVAAVAAGLLILGTKQVNDPEEAEGLV